MGDALRIQRAGLRANPNWTAAPNANTAATITLGGANNVSWQLYRVDYSYSGSGTASGSLIIQDGSNTVKQVGISANGVYAMNFDPPLSGVAGNSMTATLAAGGSNVSGAVSLHATTVSELTPANPTLDLGNISYYGEEP
jgi:hypothetical protein